MPGTPHTTGPASGRRNVNVSPTPASESPRGTTDDTDAEVPESETERWKRRVEAESRNRLKRNIRDVVLHKD
jgi:hypothetical protein